MVIFHSYVSLPKGTKAGRVKGGGRCGERAVYEELGDTDDDDPDDCTIWRQCPYCGSSHGKIACEKASREEGS